jgi:quercetin dioxygenase-like cupin family protein
MTNRSSPDLPAKPGFSSVAILLGALALFLSATALIAYPVAKNLIDSTPAESIVVNLDDFYASHALKAGEPTRGDKIFESPRCVVTLVTNKGPLIGRHIHTSTDEIVLVYKGTGEMYINGKWIPVKAGDIHVCPRGMAHATRVTGTDEMKVISIFAPPQAGGNDRIMLDD